MNEWSVDYTFRGLPDESWLIELQTDLDDKGGDAAVSADPDAGNWTISFGALAAHPLDAMQTAEMWLGKFGLGAEPVAVEILTVDELERRADQPTMPALVGASEVAEILHVTRQRVHQLRSHKGFPVPLVEVAMGPLWDARAVQRFAREWDRRPGRPALAE